MVHLNWPNLGTRGHHRHHQLGQKEAAPPLPPKGSMAVMVGEAEGEAAQPHRVVIPVTYLNHPLFRSLLLDAEEVYGFDHDGPITIPCKIEKFRRIQRIIDAGEGAASGDRYGGAAANQNGQLRRFKAY